VKHPAAKIAVPPRTVHGSAFDDATTADSGNRGFSIAAGDVVLVKASRGARLDEVAAALAEFGGVRN
jgi:UDP-N-acetylmuramyl pentapeptide synthase